MNQPIDFQVLPSPPMWMIFQILSNSNSGFDSIFPGLAVKNRTVRRLWLDYSSRPWVIDSIKMSILLLGSPIDDPGLCLEAFCSHAFRKKFCNDGYRGSDLNWDPSRNSQFSRTMAAFVQEMGLATLWESHPVLYTHIHMDGKSKSVLDHFLLSPRLLPLVDCCGIVERGDNRSRHCPIWLRIKLGSLPIRKTSPKWVPRRVDWSKATEEQKSAYKQQLQSRLVQLQAEVEQPM